MATRVRASPDTCRLHTQKQPSALPGNDSSPLPQPSCKFLRSISQDSEVKKDFSSSSSLVSLSVVTGVIASNSILFLPFYLMPFDSSFISSSLSFFLVSASSNGSSYIICDEKK